MEPVGTSYGCRRSERNGSRHVPDREDTRFAGPRVLPVGDKARDRVLLPDDQEVPGDRRLLPEAAGGPHGEAVPAGRPRGRHRGDARVGQALLPQAAPHRAKGLRQAGGGKGLRRIVLDSAAQGPRDEAGHAPAREGRVRKAPLGAGDDAGRLRPGGLRLRLRRLRRRRPRQDALPVHVVPVFQRRQVRGVRRREGRLRLPGAPRRLRHDRRRAEGRRARQRDRGREALARRRYRVEAVQEVQASLRLRGEVLQPQLRQRERQRREQGGLHPPQLHGPGSEGRRPQGLQRGPQRGARGPLPPGGPL